MTYKNIIDNLESIINAHHFVETYGYGNLSDIATPDSETPPNYPYVFINPTDINNGRTDFNLSLNMIVMTQVQDKEANELAGQDKCMQILQDIVSVYTNTNNDPLLDIETPFNVTPFKERFSDDVVGVTANITINYAKAIDGCDTPFGQYVSITTDSCPPITVTDTDGTERVLSPGETTFECEPCSQAGSICYMPPVPGVSLTTTSQSAHAPLTVGDYAGQGSKYDESHPWKDYSGYTGPAINVDLAFYTGSLEWHKREGTYDYTVPDVISSVAMLSSSYENRDGKRLLRFPNAFGNHHRYTNTEGQEYKNEFFSDASNTSAYKQYVIDHYTGLGFYAVDDKMFSYDPSTNTGEWVDWSGSLAYANSFEYAGYSDWRVVNRNEWLSQQPPDHIHADQNWALNAADDLSVGDEVFGPNIPLFRNPENNPGYNYFYINAIYNNSWETYKNVYVARPYSYTADNDSNFLYRRTGPAENAGKMNIILMVRNHYV